MQLMVDTATELPAGLRLAAQFLFDHAALKEAIERGELSPEATNIPPPPPPNVPAGTIFDGANIPPPPPPPNNVVPIRDPRDNPFRGHDGADPNFIAPLPPIDATAAPIIPPPPMNPASTAVPLAPITAPPQTMELDSSRMPWDARIHLKNKTKKKDGTWKLQRGIDAALVASVTQELHARMINSPPAEVAAPASFPGAVPVPPPPASAASAVHSPVADSGSSVPIPPPPANGAVPIPPPPVSLQPAVPVPAAPALGLSYRELVQKITDLRKDRRLTAEQVTSIVQAAGASSLQMLNSMPHLIPEVNFEVDAAVAMT